MRLKANVNTINIAKGEIIFNIYVMNRRKGKSTMLPGSGGTERMTNKKRLELLLSCESKEEMLSHLAVLTPLQRVNFFMHILKYLVPKAK